MSKELVEFWSPRFIGERFDEHTLPLEVLKDLAALEELVVEAAKQLYLKDHSDRQRLPKGFLDSVSIHLKTVGGGSAVPEMYLEYSFADSLFPPETKKYFELARDAIIQAVDAVERRLPDLGALPESLFSYFDRIGRSLRDSECIEFAPRQVDQPARLTKESRRTLVLASKNAQTYSEEIVLRGCVPEADQQKTTFTFLGFDGRRLEAPLCPPYSREVLQALVGYVDARKVLIQGVGVRNRQGVLQKIESVDHVTVLDSLDVGARLDEIAALKTGWLDGKGHAFDTSALARLSDTFDRYYPESLPLPYLYPTAEGTVQAEWSNDRFEISLEIDPATLRAEYQSLAKESSETEDKIFDLHSAEQWRALGADLAVALGGGK